MSVNVKDYIIFEWTGGRRSAGDGTIQYVICSKKERKEHWVLYTGKVTTYSFLGPGRTDMPAAWERIQLTEKELFLILL